MHIHTLEQWQHPHDFSDNPSHAERNTRTVMLLTAVTMIAEIVAGTGFGSMALLADGWHMATHVAAFGITIFAYQYARKHTTSPKYTYGTGKVSVLGGFASAVALAVIAFFMAFESVGRFFHPQAIQGFLQQVVGNVGLLSLQSRGNQKAIRRCSELNCFEISVGRQVRGSTERFRLYCGV